MRLNIKQTHVGKYGEILSDGLGGLVYLYNTVMGKWIETSHKQLEGATRLKNLPNLSFKSIGDIEKLSNALESLGYVKNYGANSFEPYTLTCYNGLIYGLPVNIQDVEPINEDHIYFMIEYNLKFNE